MLQKSISLLRFSFSISNIHLQHQCPFSKSSSPLPFAPSTIWTPQNVPWPPHLPLSSQSGQTSAARGRGALHINHVSVLCRWHWLPHSQELLCRRLISGLPGVMTESPLSSPCTTGSSPLFANLRSPALQQLDPSTWLSYPGTARKGTGVGTRCV